MDDGVVCVQGRNGVVCVQGRNGIIFYLVYICVCVCVYINILYMYLRAHYIFTYIWSVCIASTLDKILSPFREEATAKPKPRNHYNAQNAVFFEAVNLVAHYDVNKVRFPLL